MKLLRFLLVATLLISNTGLFSVNTISEEDAATLEVFFRALVAESEGGYVLFNRKPICANGILLSKSRTVMTPGHKMAVALYQGLKAWKNFESDRHAILIRAFSSDGDCQSVIMLNKEEFLKTVAENASLFRYILGPTITPESLLRTTLNEKSDFFRIYKDNKVLIGIILGFGLDNALLVSREENIQLAFDRLCEKPPSQRRQELIPHLSQECRYSLFFERSPKVDPVLEPSLGFKSINEEYLAIRNGIELASEKLCAQPAAFYFGWAKDNPKNLTFISELEETQAKIRKLLCSPNFLTDVLKLITGKEFNCQAPLSKKLSLNETEVKQVDKILSKWVWNNISKADPEFFDHFTRGFMELKRQKGYLDERLIAIENKDEILNAKKNLEASERFFSSLKQNQDYSCLVEKQLYFQEIKQGQGEIFDKPRKISVTYQIFNPEGIAIAETSSQALIDINQTIPGFAHGLKGMHVGGIREIFIHPALAYGIYTNHQKGIYLRAVVSLEEIHTEETEFPELTFCDMEFLQQPDFDKVFQAGYNQMAYNWGCRIGEHLSKSNWVNRETILKELKLLQSQQVSFQKLHEGEVDLINKIHWNIYFS